ncbi:uncharacterized protein N7458_012027 [Penicillium daleae]|uniref:Uncharacterized protein n=1 Tax=Penicillium daleae TaxID=63821 RepID=A0AAD6FWH7_9EURO|nr:uncharacterized protein N7458_012027 [Penicillium daleae]KAJ5432871.1 hypothetical protein N7458_012027 [Penicillium daleae]
MSVACDDVLTQQVQHRSHHFAYRAQQPSRAPCIPQSTTTILREPVSDNKRTKQVNGSTAGTNAIPRGMQRTPHLSI